MKSWLLVVLFTMCVASLSTAAMASRDDAQPTGAAASAQSAPCPPNAALAYWRAWNGRVPLVWAPDYLQDEFQKIASIETWAPSAQTVAELKAAQPDIAAVMKAAHMGFCDWGTPVEEDGWDSALPHLARLRTTVRVLFADSRRLGAEGDRSGAAERIASILLLSRHLRSDRLVYSVRTAQSFAVDFSMAEMQRLAAAGKLDDASKSILVDALNQMSGPDPCGMKDAVAFEPAIIRTMIPRVCHDPNAPEQFIQKFCPRVKPDDRAGSGIDQLDAAGILRAADRAAVMYQDVLANWDLPEFADQFKGIQDQRVAGDYGPVARLAGVEDVRHIRVIVARLEAIVKDTLAKVSGQAGAGVPSSGK